MSTTATKVPDAVLRISEAASLAPGGAVSDSGTVVVHLMRPCLGKGRGRHVYEAAMLKQHAETNHFDDWPMFVDHESPEAQRKAGGLPRSLRDVGGRVVKTWWDDTVQEGAGFERGAVAAEVLPVPWIQDLIRHDPKLANVSLNTHATGVRPTSRGGRAAYIVEGFEGDGSVDWVTRAGAGGQVVQILEAHERLNADDESLAVLDSMSDTRLHQWLRDQRPAVAEAITADHGDDEEDDVKPEEIQEAALTALRSEDGKAALAEATAEVVESTIRDVLPGAIGAATQVIVAEATGAATKAVRRGDMLRQGEGKIQEAKLKGGGELPDKFRGLALRQIREAADKVDDKTEERDGTTVVTETAEVQFDAIVEAAITEATELVESVGPRPAGRQRKTAVTDNGGGSDAEIQEAELSEEDEAKDDADYWRYEVREAGIDLHAAYGVPKPEPEADAAAAAAAAATIDTAAATA